MLNTGVHSRMVDFYQVGALFFELLTGLPPNYSDDKQEMFDRIATKEVKIPVNLTYAAKDLLEGLLNKDPKKRTGFVGDFQEVKCKPFFDGLDWKEVAKKSHYGPLKPHLGGYYVDKEYIEELTAEHKNEMSLEWFDYEFNNSEKNQ